MAHTPLTKRMLGTVLFEDDTIIVTRNKYGTVRIENKNGKSSVSVQPCANDLLLSVGRQRTCAVPTSNGIGYEIEGKKT